MTPDILVVGAGPTGLALALQAHDHGARVRIIEKRPSAFRPSRALVMHPRTLEVLRPLGVVDQLLERGDTDLAVRLHLGSRVLPVRLAGLPLPDTPFPHLTLLRQMEVESVFASALLERGVRVERGIELIGVRDRIHSVEVTLRTASGTEEVACAWVAGCDGSASIVRRLSGIGWRGRPYPQEIVLADLELDGALATATAHIAAGRRGIVFLLPAGELAPWRLLAAIPAQDFSPTPGHAVLPIKQAELQLLLDEAGLTARITGVPWSSRVRPEHRIARRYRRGRVFLAGDAAHTHSPAAAQGMNTGIQDAINLGWKLAFADSSARPDELLDSYEVERRPVARQVLALTRTAFWLEASTDPVAAFLRGRLAPLSVPVLPLIPGRRWLAAQLVGVLSQLRVSYHRSPLSMDGSPGIRGWPRAGERLPDGTVTSGGRRMRLHELTARPGVHVLAADPADPIPSGRYVHVHRLTGVPDPGFLAVRPDGYIGFRGRATDGAGLQRWLAGVGAGA